MQISDLSGVSANRAVDYRRLGLLAFEDFCFESDSSTRNSAIRQVCSSKRLLKGTLKMPFRQLLTEDRALCSAESSLR